MTTSRRTFLAALGAAASAPLFNQTASSAQTPTTATRRIDIHQHFVSPSFYATLNAKNATSPIPGLAAWKGYSPASAVEALDRVGIATAMLSITAPGVWFGDVQEARKLAREMNEYAASKLVSAYKGRFGLFAVLPLPDVDGSMKELEYALDTLKADGIGVLSSYEGKYLGNPLYTPLLEEMNRRRGVIYCHPFCAACGVSPTLTEAQNRGVEFVFDTTRTILSLLQTGAVARYPDIKFIWSHGGGTVPYITSRLNGVGGEKLPKGVTYELQKMYYDTAQAFNPYTMPSFRKFIPVSQIVFGTDFPLGGGSAAIVAKGLKDNGGFTDAELCAVERENALRLLPRLKA